MYSQARHTPGSCEHDLWLAAPAAWACTAGWARNPVSRSWHLWSAELAAWACTASWALSLKTGSAWRPWLVDGHCAVVTMA